jgi:tetratricopeptide (TPR) repeat protein
MLAYVRHRRFANPGREGMKTLALLAAIAVLLVATPPLPAHEAQGGAEKIGRVTFPTSCSAAVQPSFERAVALLHSFWYLEAIKAFTAVTEADPACAMGYWGIAMSGWYQIWSPPSPANLKRGTDAIAKAQGAGARTPRERDWIAAAAAFFTNTERDHPTRVLAYEKAMEQLSLRYPQDREAALFFALALQAAADPRDKTYARQRRSGELAEKVFAAEPDHPGAAHYIIHAYDYPGLATQGLHAAGRYAQFAPSVPHALHMPSHIYVLLGMWPEVIQGNVAAAAAEKARGNPDDHMHALDYLVYGYLQQGQDAEARRVVDEARAIMGDLAARKYDSGRPTAHFAMAAMEARWSMERGRWADAAAVEPRPNRFAHTEAMIYFARAIGAARSGKPVDARAAVDRLAALRDALTQARNGYWVEQVEIQHRAGAAWLARAEGRNADAVALMRSAAELEDSTEKHNITPGPIATARELLADLLLEMGQPAQAAREYERSLDRAPNRLKALHGVARASELAGDRDRARVYYGKLLALTKPTEAERPEVREARTFLAR